MSFNFGSLLTALQNSGITGTTATNVVSSVATSMLGNVATQVQTDLTQLMSLTNNPSALAATGPAIITKIESISGLPATVLPLLEQLRAACTAQQENPLTVAQLISAVESAVTAQSSLF